MLSQGVIDQSPLVSGLRRMAVTNSGGILETNMENLLRMVPYKAFFVLFQSVP